jgi:hypothetical protein
MKRFLSVVFLVCLVLAASTYGWAQTDESNRRIETVQRKDGKGDGDEKAPLLTVSWDETIPESGTVLIKAAVSDDDPFCRVEFFVKNRLFAAFAHAPYGIFVGPDTHLNQSFDVNVIATDNYGNATIANLIVRHTGLEESYTCNFSGDGIALKAEQIDPTPTGGNGLTLNYDAKNSAGDEDEDETTVEAAIIVSKDGSASGTVTLTLEDVKKTYQLTGTAEIEQSNSSVESFTLTDSDDEFTFTCDS